MARVEAVVTLAPRKGARAPRPIVVYAPSFDETAGGAVVLHYLVHRLRGLGVAAFVAPFGSGPATRRVPPPLRGGWQALTGVRRWVANATFARSPLLDTPMAREADLARAVVVYPESVDGNPLASDRVVRWLLHRPRFINRRAVFGSDELVFFFNEAFKGEYQSLPATHHLRLLWLRDDVYRDPGDVARSGTVYLIRKGGRYGVSRRALRDGRVVDGLSHAATAAAFRSAEYLVSFDPHTLYLHYAAMCGCTPVVVAPPGVPEAERAAWPRQRHGIALGFEEVAWARRTRHDLLRELRERDEAEVAQLERFCAIVAERFA